MKKFKVLRKFAKNKCWQIFYKFPLPIIMITYLIVNLIFSPTQSVKHSTKPNNIYLNIISNIQVFVIQLTPKLKWNNKLQYRMLPKSAKAALFYNFKFVN